MPVLRGRVGELRDLVDDDTQPAGVVSGLVPRARGGRIQRPRRAVEHGGNQLGQQPSLRSLPLAHAGPAHDVAGSDRLEQRALGDDPRRHVEVGVVARK